MPDREPPDLIDDIFDQPSDAPRGAGDTRDLHAKLTHLERLIAEARPVPFASSIMLNRAEIDGLVADLLASMPEDVRQARWVVKERADVLAAARSEAQRIIDEARNERARMVAESGVVQAANREAERIVEDARERGRQIRLEAEDYVDAKLANFEILLQRVLGSVERGRERLRGRLAPEELAAELALDDEA